MCKDQGRVNQIEVTIEYLVFLSGVLLMFQEFFLTGVETSVLLARYSTLALSISLTVEFNFFGRPCSMI